MFNARDAYLFELNETCDSHSTVGRSNFSWALLSDGEIKGAMGFALFFSICV